MAKNKSEKPNQNHENNSLPIWIGIGAILLVLAEIFCIMGELYAMLSTNGAVIVTIISALLLFGTTGVFIYILKNILLQKIDEQRQICEEMLQINKATYMKAKKISGQISGQTREEPAEDTAGILREIAEEICEDVAQIQQKQNEELYKRQMTIANVQIKRTQESMASMLNSNKQIMAAIEESLGAMSESNAYEPAITEVQRSIQELYELCEKIAEAQANAPAPVLTAALGPEPEIESELEPEIEFELEPEIEFELEPESMPEPEILDEIEELSPEPKPEPEADPVSESEVSGDPNHQMTPEEIAALFGNV